MALDRTRLTGIGNQSLLFLLSTFLCVDFIPSQNGYQDLSAPVYKILNLEKMNSFLQIVCRKKSSGPHFHWHMFGNVLSLDQFLRPE